MNIKDNGYFISDEEINTFNILLDKLSDQENFLKKIFWNELNFGIQ